MQGLFFSELDVAAIRSTGKIHVHNERLFVVRMGIDAEDGVRGAETGEMTDEPIFAVGQPFRIDTEFSVVCGLGVAKELVAGFREDADAELCDGGAVFVDGCAMDLREFDGLRIELILMEIGHGLACLRKKRRARTDGYETATGDSEQEWIEPHAIFLRKIRFGGRSECLRFRGAGSQTFDQLLGIEWGSNFRVIIEIDEDVARFGLGGWLLEDVVDRGLAALSPREHPVCPSIERFCVVPAGVKNFRTVQAAIDKFGSDIGDSVAIRQCRRRRSRRRICAAALEIRE